MTRIRVSAPGKLFLLGEYAVLDGGPALLTAVDQRAGVTAVDAATWRLTTVGLGPGLDSLRLGPNGSLPPGLDEFESLRLALFDEVRNGVDGHFGSSGEPLDIHVDSSSFQHDGHKLGLGSSAAVAVALTTALYCARGGELEPNTIFRIADTAHRAAQDGSGSGGDVAASVYGGMILFRRDQPPVRVALPPGLGIFAVATGTGSSTVDLVGRVTLYRRDKPDSYRRDMDSLLQLSESTADCLTSADDFLHLVDDYFHALVALTRHSGAEIVTERHRELRRLAAASDAVFKPSGAGGGDLGLVFGKLEYVDALQSTFSEAGALVITVPPSSGGVRVESE